MYTRFLRSEITAEFSRQADISMALHIESHDHVLLETLLKGDYQLRFQAREC